MLPLGSLCVWEGGWQVYLQRLTHAHKVGLVETWHAFVIPNIELRILSRKHKGTSNPVKPARWVGLGHEVAGDTLESSVLLEGFLQLGIGAEAQTLARDVGTGVEVGMADDGLREAAALERGIEGTDSVQFALDARTYPSVNEVNVSADDTFHVALGDGSHVADVLGHLVDGDSTG